MQMILISLMILCFTSCLYIAQHEVDVNKGSANVKGDTAVNDQSYAKVKYICKVKKKTNIQTRTKKRKHIGYRLPCLAGSELIIFDDNDYKMGCFKRKKLSSVPRGKFERQYMVYAVPWGTISYSQAFYIQNYVRRRHAVMPIGNASDFIDLHPQLLIPINHADFIDPNPQPFIPENHTDFIDLHSLHLTSVNLTATCNNINNDALVIDSVFSTVAEESIPQEEQGIVQQQVVEVTHDSIPHVDESSGYMTGRTSEQLSSNQNSNENNQIPGCGIESGEIPGCGIESGEISGCGIESGDAPTPGHDLLSNIMFPDRLNFNQEHHRRTAAVSVKDTKSTNIKKVRFANTDQVGASCSAECNRNSVDDSRHWSRGSRETNDTRRENGQNCHGRRQNEQNTLDSNNHVTNPPCSGERRNSYRSNRMGSRLGFSQQETRSIGPTESGYASHSLYSYLHHQANIAGSNAESFTGLRGDIEELSGLDRSRQYCESLPLPCSEDLSSNNLNGISILLISRHYSEPLSLSCSEYLISFPNSTDLINIASNSISELDRNRHYPESLPLPCSEDLISLSNSTDPVLPSNSISDLDRSRQYSESLPLLCSEDLINVPSDRMSDLDRRRQYSESLPLPCSEDLTNIPPNDMSDIDRIRRYSGSLPQPCSEDLINILSNGISDLDRSRRYSESIPLPCSENLTNIPPNDMSDIDRIRRYSESLPHPCSEDLINKPSNGISDLDRSRRYSESLPLPCSEDLINIQFNGIEDIDGGRRYSESLPVPCSEDLRNAHSNACGHRSEG